MANSWAPFISKKHFNFAVFFKWIECPIADINALFKVEMSFDTSLLYLF